MLPRSMAKNPAAYTMVAVLAMTNGRLWNRVGSITGSSWCRVRCANTAPATSATANAPRMRPSVQPHVEPSEMASTSDASANDIRPTPR